MVTRRDAVVGGVMAGVGLTVSGRDAGATGQASTTAATSGLSLALEREKLLLLGQIRDELRALRQQEASCRMPTCEGIAAIRRQQRQFLKANQKFPDFIEVGADVWDELVDWHVRSRRPLEVTVRADGRYAMPFLQTTIVLRTDYGDDQVGLGFDTRAGG